MLYIRVSATLYFWNVKGEMGDAQKSAVASFDRCWERWVPILYFMARRWYKRASNLSRAGITISKPRKARHCCGQISGWHRFSALSAAEYNPRPYRNQAMNWHSRDDLFTPHHLPALFPLKLHEASFGDCGIIVPLAGFNLNPVCQLPSCVLSSQTNTPSILHLKSVLMSF